ncbi:hypothetical protein EOW77_0035120 [Bradyrhizobium yuanmingense]|nr:hypothetical protein EOW77_0035120 [Bradyrhizobium yuanmingense]
MSARLQAALGRSASGVKSSANVVPRAGGILCPSQIRHRSMQDLHRSISGAIRTMVGMAAWLDVASP